MDVALKTKKQERASKNWPVGSCSLSNGGGGVLGREKARQVPRREQRFSEVGKEPVQEQGLRWRKEGDREYARTGRAHVR